MVPPHRRRTVSPPSASRLDRQSNPANAAAQTENGVASQRFEADRLSNPANAAALTANGIASQRFGPRLSGHFRNEFANGPAFAIDRIGDGEYTSLLVRFIAPTPFTRG